MKIQSLSCVYFSPTGTTKAIIESIAQGVNADHCEMVDITKPSGREECTKKFGDEIVILATPVYYGRVPELVVSFLSELKAEQTAAVLVVVYGNRHYDDALKELQDIAVAGKFIPVAGGAFIGEHSYSTADAPVAQGRPDNSDKQKAREFGAAVRKKLQNLKSISDIPPVAIPGQFPYIEMGSLNLIKQTRESVPMTPETDSSTCTQCGQCAEDCPTEAISPDDVTRTDRWKCIICYACIKNCPEDARQMNEPIFQAAIKDLHKKCQERKEPEYYL